ncbi:MAG: tRNA glutamyl-Q(34) synthetase GluQRS [Betaproteobacteria bacterium]|nr:tRNA glutamyl-Q(34) synthetase GluQRS [Betaproteobacteria bacterium]
MAQVSANLNRCVAFPHYVGRFAPSPTGPLHFGSVVAALGSWLDARAVGGRWLVRIEDVDTPRVVPGAAEQILRDLGRLGLEWDAEPVWQSRRGSRYRVAFDALDQAGRIFPCACSRREIGDSQLARDGSRRYPGSCRNGLAPGRVVRAWRVRSEPGEVCFDDALQGRVCEDVERDVGDFVLLRGDGVFAYQLAVVVDDAEQGVTDIVRGADLLDSTPRQIFLQRLLGYPQPRYLHLPVATNPAGEKLSKQTLARAASLANSGELLRAALVFLGQALPGASRGESPRVLLDWALKQWDRRRLPVARMHVAPAFAFE